MTKNKIIITSRRTGFGVESYSSGSCTLSEGVVFYDLKQEQEKILDSTDKSKLVTIIE